MEGTHILLSATLKILYILWMKLLNIWCKVVPVLSLFTFWKRPFGRWLLPQAMPCLRWPRAEARPAGWHILWSVLCPPPGGWGWELAPQPGRAPRHEVRPAGGCSVPG